MIVEPVSDTTADLPAESGWFGLDRTGQYAFFTGAGAAVPLTVRAVLQAHDAVRAAIAVPGVQSPEFPRSYARVGLFVYEWSKEHGGYRRVATPYGAVPSLLRADLAQRKEVPVLAIDDFRDSEAVDSDAWLRTRSAPPSRRGERHDTCPRCSTRFPIRAAIVEESASDSRLSAAHSAATVLQCPKCRHRFRANESGFLALFDSPPMRIALVLAALGGLTSFYFWYW